VCIGIAVNHFSSYVVLMCRTLAGMRNPQFRRLVQLVDFDFSNVDDCFLTSPATCRTKKVFDCTTDFDVSTAQPGCRLMRAIHAWELRVLTCEVERWTISRANRPRAFFRSTRFVFVEKHIDPVTHQQAGSHWKQFVKRFNRSVLRWPKIEVVAVPGPVQDSINIERAASGVRV
jgi:hypothetical protein